MNSLNLKNLKSLLKQRLLVPVLTLGLACGIGTYEFLKPVQATAAVAAPAAAALTDESVGALLALDRAMETVASRVTPAIVNVTVTSRRAQSASGQDVPDDIQRFFGPFGSPFGHRGNPGPQVEHGLGSGIIVSPDGYIVTNNHVIEGATDIRVTTSDRRVVPAKLIGADSMTDLAVIKINEKNLSSLPWGDSTALHPGQTVLAFGNPFGFRFTVTRGIVSALNRTNPYSDDPRKPGEFIQTDAAINPGNSGGALVNAHGEVVGINTFLISASGSFSGMGFAIPTQVAKPTVETLIRDGKVRHAYMGVGITDVTPENAHFFHVSDNNGAVVSQVEPDAPGARAGLRVGDVIREVNGHTVAGAGELQVLIGQQAPGTKVTLNVLRDGKSVTVPVTVEELNNDKRAANDSSDEQHGKGRWGIGIANVTPEMRDQLRLPSSVNGAVVTNVEPGSPADNAGLSQGDVIVEVNRHPVQNAGDVKQQLSSIPKDQDALVLVWSRGGNSFRVLHSADQSGS